MRSDRTNRCNCAFHSSWSPLLLGFSSQYILQCEAFTAIDSFTAEQLRKTETVVSATRQAPPNNDDSARQTEPGTVERILEEILLDVKTTR